MNDIKSLREYFTPEELEALRKYVEDVNAWSAEEPPKLTNKEIKSILQYAQEHDDDVPPEYMDRVIIVHRSDLHEGVSINPAEYQPGSIFEIHSDNITFDKDFEGYLKGDPQAPTYRRILCDVIYDTWYQKIYDIAPADTIEKLIDLVNKERENAREADLLKAYIPEDEDNRQRLEAAIMELLGETVTREDAQIVAAISVKYSKNTAIPIFTDKTTKDYTRQIFQVPNQNELTWKINGELEIKDTDKPQILQKALDRQYKGDYNRELLETIGAGIQKIYETEGAIPWLHINRMNLANFLGITIRKPTTEIIEAIRRGEKYFDLVTKDKDGNEKTRKVYLPNDYSFWYDLLNLEQATGFLETESGAFYRAFHFEGYDPNTDTLKCSTPFLYEAYKENHKKRIVSKTMHNNIPDYEIEKIAFLLRGSFVKIRSTATKEIIRHLIYGISNRGALRTDLVNTNNTGAAAKDKKLRSYVISYRGLIENCPALYNQLYPIDENGNIKNIRATNKITILKRAIYGSDYTISNDGFIKNSVIEKCIKNDTALFDKYADLKIYISPISLKTLDKDGIRITHHGILSDYTTSPDALRAPEVIPHEAKKI